MPTKTEVNVALAALGRSVGIGHLQLDPNNTAVVGFGEQGVVCICFHEDVQLVRLVSPVATSSPFAPERQQISQLVAALNFNVESLDALALDEAQGCFLFTRQVVDLFDFEVCFLRFVEESTAVGQWLDNAGLASEVNVSVVQNGAREFVHDVIFNP